VSSTYIQKSPSMPSRVMAARGSAVTARPCPAGWR
jgi:hypothetical protein